MRRDVARTGMADGDRGVGVLGFLDENRRHRFADDVAAPEDDDFRALGADAAADEELLNAGRSAGGESAGISEHQFPDVDWMKSVHVFLRKDSRVNGRCVDVRRERGLNKDAVNARVGIEFRQQGEEFGLGS